MTEMLSGKFPLIQRSLWVSIFVLSMVAALASHLALIHGASEPITITVRADQPGARISPQLYGVFFEEINHAGDGGLYAELVRNRDMEEPVGQNGHLPGWELRADSASGASIAV